MNENKNVNNKIMSEKEIRGNKNAPKSSTNAYYNIMKDDDDDDDPKLLINAGGGPPAIPQSKQGGLSPADSTPRPTKSSTTNTTNNTNLRREREKKRREIGEILKVRMKM